LRSRVGGGGAAGGGRGGGGGAGGRESEERNEWRWEGEARADSDSSGLRCAAMNGHVARERSDTWTGTFGPFSRIDLNEVEGKKNNHIHTFVLYL